jgi:hypothetical protein
MSIKTIQIPSYKTKNNLLKHFIKIAFDEIDLTQSFDSSYNVDLYNLEIGSRIIIPREVTKTLTLSLSFEWEDGKNINDVKELISIKENPFEITRLRIQVYSQFSKYCLEQKSLNLNTLSKNNEINFTIDLSKIYGSIAIEYYITRDTQVEKDSFDIAEKPLSILSSHKEIEIVVDDIESERLKRSFLPISPADTGQFLFVFSGLENSGSDLPEIHYHQDFDNYFKQDDLLCVDTTFMFAFLSFIDNYLKWLLFKSNYSDSKQYLALIDFISETLEIRPSELKEIIFNKPDTDELVEKYLSYSKKLFENFQIKKKFKFKKHLKTLIEKEKRIKILSK